MDAESKPPAPTTLHDVPDRLLEPILERLMSSPLCLVRAAATCKRWRRIMGRSWFFVTELCKARPRAPYPRPVAGNYYNRVSPLGGREIAFVPTAQHGVESRRFSLDFLPDIASWDIVDSRGSLLLLCDGHDLIVCEPLTGLYQGILWPGVFRRRLVVFLLDGGDEDSRVSMSNFRVTCALFRFGDRNARACAFSAAAGGWTSATALSSKPVFPDGDLDPIHFAGSNDWSAYWTVGDITVIVLDEDAAELLSFVMPDN